MSIEFDNGWVEPGGQVGISIYALGAEVLRFSFSGGDSTYRTTDSAGTLSISLLPFSTDGMTVLVSQHSNGTYDLDVDGFLMRSGRFSGGMLFADELRVFSDGAGTGPLDHDVYFNCLEVVR